MGAAKKLFNFYINSSIHVALAVVSLVLITWINFEIPLEKNLLFFILFGSICGYNFVKYAGITGLHHRSLTKRLRFIQVFTLLCLVGFLISAFLVEMQELLWSAFFGLFTLLYALPVFSKRRNLRSISGVKIFIIAFVWAGVTVVLPVLPFKNSIFDTLLPEFLQRFLLVLVWILPFEIRDLKYDLEQLGTLPQRIGVTKTKVLGIILLLVVIGLELWKSTATAASISAIIIMCLVTGLLVWSSKERQSRYFSAFWVEGIPILWWGLLWLFRSF